MAEILLFHHALGLTPGVLRLADTLRAAGHVVHTPDLFEGRTFATLKEGVAHAEQIGFGLVIARGRAAAEGLPSDLVYAGLSLGVMPAQYLAQKRPGARGALLLHSAVPIGAFGGVWPEGLPLQMHTMEDDSWGDVDIAQELADALPEAELFLYPGEGHLFSDDSDRDYDAEATALLTERALAFLQRV